VRADNTIKKNFEISTIKNTEDRTFEVEKRACGRRKGKRPTPGGRGFHL